MQRRCGKVDLLIACDFVITCFSSTNETQVTKYKDILKKKESRKEEAKKEMRPRRPKKKQAETYCGVIEF